MKTIELFQWDLNRSIEVPSGSKAHFASVGSLQALVVMEQGGKASVPNILLQEPKDINVWIVRDGATTDSGKIRITSRPVPSDYVYTETDVETVETLTQAMVAAIESEIAHAEAQIAAAKAQADEATQTANQAITQAQETHKIAEADIAENRQLRETLKAEEAKRATAETNRKAEETKRVEAEAARKSAEATRAANETKRTETFNSNLVSWNSKVDAACKKATDTASKAAQDVKTATDAAIAQTQEATNAAVAKAQTATDNATTAANKAEAAVSKLPLPLGNTLKGEVESTMVSVHDAYPAPLVTTKVMGQSNQQQEPAPSPENPQEITNLNKAELVITGRNICPDAELLGKVSYNSGIPTNKYGIQAKFPYVQTSETDGIGAVLNTIKGVTYSIAYLGKANTAAVGIAEYKSVDDVGDVSKVVSYARVGSSKKISLTASIDGVMVFVLASQWSNGTTNLNTFAKEDMIISIGEPCNTYTPHKSKSTPINLKGNELCSLPNGVKDEVVIDAEGNVSLIKRVGKYDLSTVVNMEKHDKYGIQSNMFRIVINGAIVSTLGNTANNISCNCLNPNTSAYVYKNLLDNYICGLDVFMHTKPYIAWGVKGITTVEAMKVWLAEHKPVVLYGMAEPQIIQLGKVELPALPEATSNVWNDGNIPANVYINYLKDVNIAYTDLENQIKQITAALSVMDTPTVIPEMAWGTPAAI